MASVDEASGEETSTTGFPRTVAALAGAFVLCVPAVVASGWIVGLASGPDQVNVLGDAALVLLAWLSVPLSFLLLRRIDRGPWTAALGIVVATCLSLAFTVWISRPQAPDGSAHPHSYEETVSQVSGDVESWLEKTEPGRWHRLDRSRESSPCVDRYGRDRGAVYGGPWYGVDGVFSPDRFDEFERATSGPGREIQAEAFGRPEDLRGQRHDRVVIRLTVFEDQGRSTIEIVTPCLRVD